MNLYPSPLAYLRAVSWSGRHNIVYCILCVIESVWVLYRGDFTEPPNLLKTTHSSTLFVFCVSHLSLVST